ncbi:MAG TPA: hypothetical protein VNA69_08555 [Thermoanaerobaculia bacterium]|nr:hypothetical protein [Thermoanaerobaculia bacterium]
MSKTGRVRALLRSDLAIAIGVAILYVVCAKLGLALAIRAAQVTAVWREVYRV